MWRITAILNHPAPNIPNEFTYTARNKVMAYIKYFYALFFFDWVEVEYYGKEMTK